MANLIKLRRSAEPGKIPTTAQLDLGELAINTYDGRLYLKKNVNGTESIIDVNAGITAAEILTLIKTVDGTGSGLDADLLDGLNTSSTNLASTVMTRDASGQTGIAAINFDGTATVTPAAGLQWYDAATGSWNLGMGGGNITQQIGEELFRYGKASSAVSDTNLQLIYKTGVVGASGVITFAPAVANITESDIILGIATEPIPLNSFGRITTYGVVHGIDTTGSVYGETWVDGEDIWYNPITGGLTKIKPQAPNIKVQIGTVINAGTGGSGSFIVKLGSSSSLGGTDSNVEITSVTNKDILQYNSSSSRWENKQNLSLNGTISHTGLVTTEGTNTDQLKTITKSITLTTDWQDTGISSTDLATGTYIVQLFANDISAGGSNNNEYYSGTMSWYSGTVNTSIDLPTDEIPLHRAGGSSDAGLYLRTYRSANSTLKLQMYSNAANASASNYVFKFRRVI